MSVPENFIKYFTETAIQEFLQAGDLPKYFKARVVEKSKDFSSSIYFDSTILFLKLMIMKLQQKNNCG